MPHDQLANGATTYRAAPIGSVTDQILATYSLDAREAELEVVNFIASLTGTTCIRVSTLSYIGRLMNEDAVTRYLLNKTGVNSADTLGTESSSVPVKVVKSVTGHRDGALPYILPGKDWSRMILLAGLPPGFLRPEQQSSGIGQPEPVSDEVFFDKVNPSADA